MCQISWHIRASYLKVCLQVLQGRKGLFDDFSVDFRDCFGRSPGFTVTHALLFVEGLFPKDFVTFGLAESQLDGEAGVLGATFVNFFDGDDIAQQFIVGLAAGLGFDALENCGPVQVFACHLGEHVFGAAGPEVQIVEHEVVGRFAVNDIGALVGGLDGELAHLQALVLEGCCRGRLDVFDGDGVILRRFGGAPAETCREGERE